MTPLLYHRLAPVAPPLRRPPSHATQALEWPLADLLRARGGTFVSPAGEASLGTAPWRGELSLVAPGLRTRGCLRWCEGGRVRLTFRDLRYGLADGEAVAAIDGGREAVPVFTLDTAGTRVELIDTSTRPGHPFWAPRITGTIARLAPAAAEAFNAAFGTRAFNPGMHVGPVAFHL